MKGWLCLALILICVGFVFGDRIDENVQVDLYRVRRDNVSPGQINSIKAMGRNTSKQPFQRTDILTPDDTTYYLIRISTVTKSESVWVDKLINVDGAELYQRWKMQIVFSNQIGGSYNAQPILETDNSLLYPVDNDWEYCHSPPCEPRRMYP